jgi:hypothetical protein
MDENEDAPQDEEQEEPADERKPLGWRDLPSVVNIKDFAQMVGGEVEQIGGSLRVSLESFGRLPFGPILGFIGLFILSIRSCLLVLVIFVFGTGILLVTLIRALGFFSRGRKRTSEKD